MNDAFELGAPARYVPLIIVKVMLPAPSRDTAAAAYDDSATAKPVGL